MPRRLARQLQPASSAVKVYLLLETGGGGAGRHVLDLYAGLVATGWNVHLLLSSTRMDPAFTAEVAALPQEHITFLRLRRSPHLSDVGVIRQIRRQLKADGDLVILHAHSTKAAIVAWALRGSAACRIFTPHAYRGMDPGLKGYRSAAIRAAERVFSHPFQSVIAVSGDEVGYAAGLGVRPGRIHLIPNGVDAATIREKAGEGLRSREGGQHVLGFLGRLVEQKNPRLFLRVLHQLVQRGQDVRAVVLGDGPLLPELQAMAEDLQLQSRIRWVGMVPALGELANLDVLVHTSAYESLPYSLLEAVAADLPVVAVCNAGSRAIFGDLFPRSIVHAGTAEALADEVCALLGDTALRQKYRESYAEIAERFSTGGMVSRTVAVYDDALRTLAQPGRVAAPSWLQRPGMPLGIAGLLRRAVRGNTP